MSRHLIFQGYSVSMGSADYHQQKEEAEEVARECGGRVDWQDEYNDYSARGCFVVITRR